MEIINPKKKGPSPLKKSKKSASGSKLSLIETSLSDEEEMEDVMFLFSDEDSADTGKGKASEVVLP